MYPTPRYDRTGPASHLDYVNAQARECEAEPITPGSVGRAVQVGTPQEQRQISETIRQLFEITEPWEHLDGTAIDSGRSGHVARRAG